MIKNIFFNLVSIFIGAIFFGGFWRAYYTDMPGSSLLFPDSTIFSKDYKESKFKKIKINMSSDEVQSVIGYPILREKACKENKEIINQELRILGGDTTIYSENNDCEYVEYWNYSIKGPAHNAYYVRKVIFKDDIVVDIKNYMID